MRKNVSANARHVHSLLARALVDPVLLERWRHNPSALNKMGSLSRTLDINRVWRFSGLATKVRHNDVRIVAPLTFKLLDLAGISIELFATYASRADVLRKEGKKSASEKLSSVSCFLSDWLDRDNPVHCLIWDLIRHESAILELQTVAPSQPPNSDDPVFMEVSLQSMPTRGGTLIHHEMSCNPVELARRLRIAPNQIPSLQRGQYYFAYCQGSDSTRIKVLEIDALGSVVIDLCDGHRTIGKISRLMNQAGISLEGRDLSFAVKELVANGLLALGSRSGA